MFCKNCGKEVADGMKFCDGCGSPLEQPTNAGQQPDMNGQQPYQSYTTNTPPPPYQQNPVGANANDSSNKIIFVLAYLGILFFLPLVVCPNSAVGKFHANQGLLLLLVSIVGQIVFSIITFAVPFLYFLSTLFALAILALMIYGMVNAYNDKQVPLPVIGTLFTLIK